MKVRHVLFILDRMSEISRSAISPFLEVCFEEFFESHIQDHIGKLKR